MRDLVIYGAGWPDTVKIIAAINRRQPSWNILGVLDDTPGRAGESFMGFEILGGHDQLERLTNEKTSFINNVASTTTSRAKVNALLENHGCDLATLVHPTADQTFTDIGHNVLIADGTVLGADVVIRDHCVIRPNALVAHDGILSKNVFIGPGATLCGHSVVAEGAYIGAGSTIIEHISIGAGCTVGAGAVVVEDVPPGTTVVGIPARPVSLGGTPVRGGELGD